ncbi:MAG: Fic family protein [Gammaproteobacteria bacterium]|nr:Fic family protein [Gammaproteobacteria bacterium]MYE30260.1 Fic family protein [Gammaproteobacteria bacterium]
MDGGKVRIDTLRITSEFLRLIAALDEFKGAWEATGRIAPERLLALRRVATIESIGSSTRIEGASLTDIEVERLLSRLDITTFDTRDEQEVAGYADAMNLVFDSWTEIDLTENHIKQLHQVLLQHSSKDLRHRGDYKTHDNHLEAFAPDGTSLGVVFRTATPFDTPRLTRELVDWTRAQFEADDHHRLVVIAVFVVTFLQIHPFQDGNGRLSRILTTLLLLRAGYAYAPFSSLESVIEQSKEEYYSALRQTQRTIRGDTPDWQPWLGYFLRSLTTQKDRLEAKIDRERLLFESLPELSRQLLELCREHGRLTVAMAVSATGGNRNTIKGHIKSLCGANHLRRHGAGRGAWYSLRQGATL